MKTELVIATANAGKLAEFSHHLHDYFQILSQKDIQFQGEIVEDGQSFEENALIKARAIFAFSGKATLADDSGLEVKALGGAPGIYTARFAGPAATDLENIQKLLLELKDKDTREASFVCVLAYINSQGQERLLRAEVHGHIHTEICGDQGFGYDPIFIAQGQTRTYAQMTTSEKKALSHRGCALQKLIEELEFIPA